MSMDSRDLAIETLEATLREEKKEKEKWLRDNPAIKLESESDDISRVQNIRERMEYGSKRERKAEKLRKINEWLKKIEKERLKCCDKDKKEKFGYCTICEEEIPENRLLAYLENSEIDLDHCLNCNGGRVHAENLQLTGAVR